MKRKKIFFIVLFCIIFSKIKEIIEKENKILFKIKNEIITTIDILNEIKYLSIINKEFNNAKKDQKIQIAKNSIIKEKIKIIEKKNNFKNLDINNSILEGIIIKNFNRLNINSISEFELFFKENNINSNSIKKKISIEMLWNQLVYNKFYKSVKIDEQEIKNSLSSKKKQKEYLLSELVFEVKSNENLQTKLNYVKTEIIKKGFAQAVMLHSISDSAQNGGKLEWITEAVLNNKIKKLIKIQKGEFTNPMVIPGGFNFKNRRL